MIDTFFSGFENNYDIPMCDAIMDNGKHTTISAATLIKRKGHVPVIGQEVLDEELIRFYSAIEKWEFRWKTRETSPVQIQGTIRFVSAEKILDADRWDLLPDKYPRVKNFTLLDYFYNEAAVGLYLSQPEKGLFYFEFDGDPRPLGLDFKGYLEMLKYTKGAAYWQLSVINPSDRSLNRVIEELSQIFPEVSVAGFYELYDRVKLK